MMEWVNSKLQLSHRNVQRAIAAPTQPYTQRCSEKYDLCLSAAEYATAQYCIEQTPAALIFHGLCQPAEPFSSHDGEPVAGRLDGLVLDLVEPNCRSQPLFDGIQRVIYEGGHPGWIGLQNSTLIGSLPPVCR